MTVFTYNDYKEWVNEWVSQQPKGGYGLYSRMAEALGSNSVLISQTFKGERELPLESAVKLCQFMSLGTLETDYFLLLVQRERAGSHDLKQILTRQLQEVRLKGQALKNRIEHEQLSDEDKAQFYSSWLYIGTWLTVTTPEFQTTQQLAQRFQVPEAVLRDVIRFLIDKQLLVKKGARFDFGKNVVHVPHDSHHVSRHHLNWRMKAMQMLERKKEADLYYTAPMSMSHELKKKIREEIVQFIQRQNKAVGPSPSEAVVALNIDFFELG